MAPRETENNAYAKFWGDKKRALWYVMVFLEWSIRLNKSFLLWAVEKLNKKGNISMQITFKMGSCLAYMAGAKGKRGMRYVQHCQEREEIKETHENRVLTKCQRGSIFFITPWNSIHRIKR